MQKSITLGNTTITVHKQKNETMERIKKSTKNYINYLLAYNGYFLKQKLSGLALFLSGIASIILLHDGTFSVFCCPIGIGLMLTKEDVMMF